MTIAVKPPNVVYFDQHLGAAHSKRWLKYAFSCFGGKMEKSKKIEAKLSKKNVLFEFAPRHWSRVLFPEKLVYTHTPLTSV